MEEINVTCACEVGIDHLCEERGLAAMGVVDTPTIGHKTVSKETNGNEFKYQWVRFGGLMPFPLLFGTFNLIRRLLVMSNTLPNMLL